MKFEIAHFFWSALEGMVLQRKALRIAKLERNYEMHGLRATHTSTARLKGNACSGRRKA